MRKLAQRSAAERTNAAIKSEVLNGQARLLFVNFLKVVEVR